MSVAFYLPRPDVSSLESLGVPQLASRPPSVTTTPSGHVMQHGMGPATLPLSYPPPVLAYARSFNSQMFPVEAGAVAGVGDTPVRWWFPTYIIASLFVCASIGLIAYMIVAAAAL